MKNYFIRAIRFQSGQARTPIGDNSNMPIHIMRNRLLSAVRYYFAKYKEMRKLRDPRLVCGQAILLSVIMLNGILISASAVAGLLITYQIRQANDSVESTKAFFAADAGIEDALYCYYMVSSGAVSCANTNYYLINSAGNSTKSSYSNIITSQFNTAIPPEQIGFVISSIGNSGRTQRTLETRIKTNF